MEVIATTVACEGWVAPPDEQARILGVPISVLDMCGMPAMDSVFCFFLSQ